LRKVVIAGNWKMFKTQAESKAFLAEFLPQIADLASAAHKQVVVCVPYTDLAILTQAIANSGLPNLSIGAQNVHWAESGAFTGEISAAMLTEIGIKYVVIGHSERRQYFGETDQTVNARLKAAQQHGMTPILCVGESKQQRDANETEAVIFDQLKQDLDGIDQQNLIIAYEPIWAIGTGDTCETIEANRVIGLIRQQLTNPEVPIQYGGSVKPNLIDEIMAQPEIDGVLVGGASLDANGFARIVNYQTV
jgi:triosephosphate isomerase